MRFAIKSTTVRFLRARANVWDAWLGFNISHSLGMFLFGCAVVYFGLNFEHLEPSKTALAIPVAIGLIYFTLVTALLVLGTSHRIHHCYRLFRYGVVERLMPPNKALQRTVLALRASPAAEL